MKPRRRVVLILIFLIAFVLRLAPRLAEVEERYLSGGYSLYLVIASNFLDGHGLCEMPGKECALRMPLYPLFLTPWLAAGWLFPGLIVIQSGIGAALSWLAWRLGRNLFDERAGMLAAGMAALNPYAIVHDTALQETVLINALMALGVLLLIQARHCDAAKAVRGTWVGGGLVFGLAVLTTARVALIVPFLLAWILLAGGATWQARLRNSAFVGLPILLLVGGWMMRNWWTVGTPVMTTESGESFWVANNEWSMAHFPKESIDLSVEDSYRAMTVQQSAEFAKLRPNEVARDRLLGKWGRTYVAAHPIQTLRNASYKVWVVASGQLSPARSVGLQLTYSFVFVPIHLLAAIGLWRSRRDWTIHGIVYAVLVSFGVTTATFWAHTSHKSYVDLFLFVYAASVVWKSPHRTLAGPGIGKAQ